MTAATMRLFALAQLVHAVPERPDASYDRCRRGAQGRDFAGDPGCNTQSAAHRDRRDDRKKMDNLSYPSNTPKAMPDGVFAVARGQGRNVTVMN